MVGQPHTMERIRSNTDYKQRKIVRNGKELNAAFAEIQRATQEEISELTRDTAIRLYKKCSIGTPIKTGRARAGWQLSEDTTNYVPDKNVAFSPQYLATNEEQQIIQTLNEPASEMYYIINNVEYIQRLEAGHSKQAPNGWIANALVETKKELQRNIKAMNNR